MFWGNSLKSYQWIYWNLKNNNPTKFMPYPQEIRWMLFMKYWSYWVTSLPQVCFIHDVTPRKFSWDIGLTLVPIYLLEKMLWLQAFSSFLLFSCVTEKLHWMLFMKCWFCKFVQENVLATCVPQVYCVDIAYTRT